MTGGRPGATAVRRALVVAGACFVGLALIVMLDGTPPGDALLREAMLALATPPVLATLRVINVAGSWRFLLPATLLLLLAFGDARRRWYLWVGLMAGAPLVEGILKWLIARPRPEDLSAGFPSGHATAAAAFMGLLVYLAAGLPAWARRWTRVLAVAVVALVGSARIMLRAHWPSDVVAGVALGVALAAAAILAAEAIDLRSRRR